MPVQILSFDYPPLSGGIARLMSGLAGGLAARGRDVEVVTQDSAAGEGPMKPPVQEPTLPLVRVTRARPWREITVVSHLRRVRKGSLLICGNWYPEGLTAVSAGVREFVVMAYGAELLPGRDPGDGVRSRLQRLVLRRASVVVAISRYTADLVQRIAPDANVAVVTPGVDEERFSPGDVAAARQNLGIAPEVRVLSTVSRLREFKGHATVLRTLAALSEAKRERFIYLIAGTGPHEPALRNLASELRVEAQVRWLGQVPEARLADVYRASDLSLLCTRPPEGRREVEGFGLALLESQACGVPVVGTRTGGIPDAVLEGEGGWLIEPDDTAALGEILERLLQDPQPFREAGRRARERVEREATLGSFVERFEAALTAGGCPIA